MSTPLLKVDNLSVKFPASNFNAVDQVSFELQAGETLGIVGESGCGKSTLARAILQLIKPSAGQVLWQAEDLSQLNKKQMRAKRKELQVIFQDPLASLNPRMTIGEIIAEPLIALYPEISKSQRKQKVLAMMKKVGLLESTFNRYPHEFSGGQCQRVGIARALIVEPKLVICDEPVSALDVSIQAQIINLLLDLKQEMDLALIFIAHNLSVVELISDRVAVMYLGKIVEIADAKTLYQSPKHPYTKALLSAILEPYPKQRTVKPD